MAAHFRWTGCGHGGFAQGVSALLLESGQDPRAGLASASPPPPRIVSSFCEPVGSVISVSGGSESDLAPARS